MMWLMVFPKRERATKQFLDVGMLKSTSGMAAEETSGPDDSSSTLSHNSWFILLVYR